MKRLHYIVLLLLSCTTVFAQERGIYDTIRLGGVEVEGRYYPFVFLPEVEVAALMPSQEQREHMAKLRSNVFAVYYYANTAATLLNGINGELEKIPDRKSRRQYLKSMNRQLDAVFKDPLKNLSVEQGHVLIKLINRQTGNNCYHIIRELKGGVSAVMWQSVGLLFNNNLRRNYDPQGDDRELELVVQELEASTAYKYQLYLQQEMMKKVTKK